jgi:HEAT repeat protein
MPEQALILSLLERDDPESQRQGAQLAGDEKLSQAVPALVNAMSSPNIGVQEAVDHALRSIGGPTVVHAVIPLLRSENVPVRNIAMDILRELGQNDLPAVEALLRDHDPDVRIFASDILGSMNSVGVIAPLCSALLHDPEVNVRYQAAVSLGNLAFPESARCLNKAMQDEEWVQFAVIEALTKIGDSASTKALLKAFDQASDLVASIIVDAIGEMGDIKAVPQLLRKLESSPAPLRNKIIRAILSIMGPRTLSLLGQKACDRLRDYLPSVLEDEDPDVQAAAVRGFAALGGEKAIEHLMRHALRLDPEREAERISLAIEAMVAIGHTTELDTALREGDDLSTQIAMNVLLQTDPQAAATLLMDIFWKRSRDMQRIIIMELAERLNRENQEFFLDVLKRHKDGKVLRGALVFLGRKGDPDVAFDAITPFLTHPYDDVKESAVEALVHIHSPRVEALFKSMLVGDDPVRRMMGAYGLGFFDLASTADALQQGLDDENPDVRKLAVLAIGRNGPLDGRYMEMLEVKLDDPDSNVRMAAFDTLGECADNSCVGNLISGLADSDTWVRVRCAERLGEKKAVEAVIPLVNMLAEDNPLIVIKAVNALGMIGGESAFRALFPLLDNPDPDLHAAAEEAINAIRAQAGE